MSVNCKIFLTSCILIYEAMNPIWIDKNYDLAEYSTFRVRETVRLKQFFNSTMGDITVRIDSYMVIGKDILDISKLQNRKDLYLTHGIELTLISLSMKYCFHSIAHMFALGDKGDNRFFASVGYQRGIVELFNKYMRTIVPWLCLMAGLALIVFRKRHAYLFTRTMTLAQKKKVISDEKHERFDKAGGVKTLNKFYEFASVALGIVLLLISVPNFIPATYKPVRLILIFLVLCVASACGAAIGTLLLWPLWGRQVKNYMKEKHFMYSVRDKAPSSATQFGYWKSKMKTDDPVLQDLQAKASKYGTLCSTALFIIFLLILIILAKFFIWN